MTYEESAKKLEEIISKLEIGEISLSESSKLFEQGIALAKDCYAKLEEQKGKITKIKQNQETFFEEIMN